MQMHCITDLPELPGVHAIWVLSGHSAARNCGLPKPFVELVFSFSGLHFWQRREDSPSIAYDRGWVTPIQSGPRYARTEGAMHLIGARLDPLLAAMLFRGAALGDDGRPIPIDEMGNAELWDLREQMCDQPEDEARCALLHDWLGRKTQSIETGWLPSQRELSKIGWRVDALADMLQLSPRGLHKRFVDHLGVGPKLWLQLGRFDALLQSDPSCRSLAETAAVFGYTDQAHMTAEFRRFAGTSPGRYMQERDAARAPPRAPHFLPGQ